MHNCDLANMRRWVSDFALTWGAGWKDCATIRDILRFAIDEDDHWTEYKLALLCKVLAERMDGIGGGE